MKSVTIESYSTCPHFPRCGGCQTLDRAYSDQLNSKRQRLESLFGFTVLRGIPDLLPSPRIHHYRHKVQLPFGMKKNGHGRHVTLGCYARDSHEVVDQHACLVQDRELSLIAWAVRAWADEEGLSTYDERRGTGFLRHVLLRKGANTGEMLIGLVTAGGRPAGSRRLAETLLAAARRAVGGLGSRIVGIVQNINERATNVVLGDREHAWWGRPFIRETLGPYRFSVGLSTFFQVNPFQTPRLYDEVLRRIEGGPAVIDAFCGVGSITLWVSKKARLVAGIEENGASIAAAKRAAVMNGVRNVRFFRETAETRLPRLVCEGFDVVIVNPPRKGLDHALVSALGDAPVKRIIYVSCDPESLARDVRLLSPAWTLISLQGVDMFPHTTHIECVAVLDRK